MSAVAVIGGGIAGLGAARALAGRHRVTVIEAAPTCGGHVHTVDVDGPRGRVAIDVGFIVHNRARYPRFTALLDELGVPTRATSMAFSVAVPDGPDVLEWGSASLGAMFAQRRRLGDLAHWRFLVEVARFLRRGRRALPTLSPEVTLDAFLAGSPAEIGERFARPLAAALWSLAPARCGTFPAATYLRFLDQHGMLRPVRPLEWRTIVGGSRRYVDALLARAPIAAWTDTPARRIHRDARGVAIELGGAHAGTHRFDHVVVACHADQALALLDEPSADERAILGAFTYGDNRVTLHNDERYLPRATAARASWNYALGPSGARTTYWMNRLCGLDDDVPYLVTVEPPGAPSPRQVLASTTMRHPQLDAAAIAAAGAIDRLQGARRTSYAGAYLGFGFHEDGLRAGEAAATAVDRAEAAA